MPSYTDPIEYYLRQQERRDNQIRNILSTFLAAKQNKQEQGWKEKEYGLKERSYTDSLKQQELENRRREKETEANVLRDTAYSEYLKRPAKEVAEKRPDWMEKYDALKPLFPGHPEKAVFKAMGISEEGDYPPELVNRAANRLGFDPKAWPKMSSAYKGKIIEKLLDLETPPKPTSAKDPDVFDKKKTILDGMVERGEISPAQYRQGLLGVDQSFDEWMKEVKGGEAGRKDIPPGTPPDVVAYMNENPKVSFKEAMAIYQRALKKAGK